MKLSLENKATLLTHLHKSIKETANSSANNIAQWRVSHLINYPSNGGFSEKEIRALELLKGNEELKSALRKVLASTTAEVLFNLCNIIDGTADPDPGTGTWSEVMLVDKPEDLDEDIEFLHEDFYATYFEWKEKRKNTNWSLDKI